VFVDVVACGRDLDVVTAALALGRALVKGGNRRVQDAMFRYFQEQTAKAEGFFEQLRVCIAAEVSHIAGARSFPTRPLASLR
jgi:hypothetical protein